MIPPLLNLSQLRFVTYVLFFSSLFFFYQNQDYMKVTHSCQRLTSLALSPCGLYFVVMISKRGEGSNLQSVALKSSLFEPGKSLCDQNKSLKDIVDIHANIANQTINNGPLSSTLERSHLSEARSCRKNLIYTLKWPLMPH